MGVVKILVVTNFGSSESLKYLAVQQLIYVITNKYSVCMEILHLMYRNRQRYVLQAKIVHSFLHQCLILTYKALAFNLSQHSFELFHCTRYRSVSQPCSLPTVCHALVCTVKCFRNQNQLQTSFECLQHWVTFDRIWQHADQMNSRNEE